MKGGSNSRRCDMKNSKKVLTFFLVAGLLLAFVAGLSAEETGKVNINKASLEELAQLKRVGPKYAERIINYREEHGGFKQVEDIIMSAENYFYEEAGFDKAPFTIISITKYTN